jgi:hypothetical protein
LSSAVPRAVVEAFYHALSIRDLDALARFLDDDVVWTISGPPASMLMTVIGSKEISSPYKSARHGSQVWAVTATSTVIPRKSSGLPT